MMFQPSTHRFSLSSIGQLLRVFRGRPHGPNGVEGEERFEALFDMAAVGIAQVAMDGHWLTFNRKFCQITGYSAEELADRTWQQLTHPDDVPSELTHRQRLVAGEMDTYARDKRYVRKDGTIAWVSINVSLVRSARGEPKYFISVVQDISELNTAEAARCATELRLKVALDAAEMGTWEWNLATGREVWSEKMEELIGLPSGGFAGTRDAFLELVHPDDRGGVRDAARRAIAGNAPYRCEYRITRPNGSIAWISSRGDVIRDAAGVATHMVGVTRDVTERKRAEQERADLLAREQRARAEAETANRRKDQFLAVLSHELRTPLTPVIARLALLKRNPGLPHEVHAALDMIRRNVELEARLIADILDLTHISRGTLQLQWEIVDAHQKVRNAVEIYQTEIAAKRLEVRLDLRAEKYFVRADSSRLQQIFWNLISNAVKYTPAEGRITVRSSSDADGMLTVQVIDSGIGIDPDVMSRLFNPFEQGEQTLSRHYGGLGLGLSISRTLVTMHGGKLLAHSDGRNRGATFTVQLPGGTADMPPAPPRQPTPQRALRILLVEDNEDTLRVMARLLRMNGHHVWTAAGLHPAVELSLREDFDLLISDIGLPDGTGWELMRTLRARHPVRGIALSGFAMEEDAARSREAGFVEHLSKPINPQELEEAIQRAAAGAEAVA